MIIWYPMQREFYQQIPILKLLLLAVLESGALPSSNLEEALYKSM